MHSYMKSRFRSAQRTEIERSEAERRKETKSLGSLDGECTGMPRPPGSPFSFPLSALTLGLRDGASVRAWRSPLRSYSSTNKASRLRTLCALRLGAFRGDTTFSSTNSTDQLNRAALSIATNLTEGNGRFTVAGRHNCLAVPIADVQSPCHELNFPIAAFSLHE
jgi:hypothetical protein